MKNLKIFLFFVVFLAIAFLSLFYKKSDRQSFFLKKEQNETSHRSLANNFGPFFHPDFSGNAYILPQATSLQPVCFNLNSSLCFDQWMSQANSLSTSQAGQPAGFNFFVPSFIPQSATFINPEGNSNFERVRLPRPSRRDRYSETRVFYSNKDNPDQIVLVETNPETQEKTSTLGSVVYVNTESIEQVGGSTESLDIETEGQAEGAEGDKETRPSADPAPPADPAPLSIPDTPTGATVPPVTSTPPSSAPTLLPASPGSAPKPAPEISAPSQPSVPESSAGMRTPPSRPANFGRTEPTTQQEGGSAGVATFQTSEATVSIPAEATGTIKSGCVVIDKKNIKTEASFCSECIRNTEQNRNFKALIATDNFLTQLRNNLTAVVASSKYKTGLSSDNGVTKICSPQETLKSHINRFESSCKYPGGFKQFFKDHLCKSCKKGIPMELMMAMMSIESGGNCKALNTRGEQSAGLFQVNSNTHKCGSGYTRGTSANTQCLMKINNNWNKATKILSDKFCITNGGLKENGYPKTGDSCSNWLRSKIGKSGTTCPSNRTSWLTMGSHNRDAFRRAVSAYNGGEAYTLGSLFYGTEGHQAYKGTKGKYRYGKKEATWEELRAFYFITRIKYKKGRTSDNTKSNLAHTEAVLGREVKPSAPGMVEIWSQYKRNFLAQNSSPCSN